MKMIDVLFATLSSVIPSYLCNTSSQNLDNIKMENNNITKKFLICRGYKLLG